MLPTSLSPSPSPSSFKPAYSTASTLARTLKAILNRKSFLSGAEHRYDNLGKTVLQSIPLGLYHIKHAWYVHHKEKELEAYENLIFQKIIEAIPDPSDPNNLCSCNIKIANTSTTITIKELTNHNISISDSAGQVFEISVGARTKGEAFNILKRELLKYFIKEKLQRARERDEQAKLTLDVFNLSSMTDYEGVDFENTLINERDCLAIVRGKGSLRGAKLLSGVDVKLPADNPLSFDGVKLDRHWLNFFKARNANLRGVDLSGLNDPYDRNKNLDDINLTGIDLTQANFGRSSLKNAQFNLAIINQATFYGAYCAGTNFTGVVANNVTRSPQTILTGSIFHDAKGVKNFFPKNATSVNGRLGKKEIIALSNETDRKNFTGVTVESDNPLQNDLSNLDELLKDKNFQDATLSNTDFSNSNLTKTNFNGAKLHNIKMDAQTTLNGTDFSNADLNGADLSKKTFDTQQANNAVILHNATLEGARLNKAWVNQAIKHGVRNFEKVIFIGDLSDVDFNGCNLKDADFKNATFNRTRFNESALKAAIKTREEIVTKTDNDGNKIEERKLDLSGIICEGTQNNLLVLSSNLEGERVDLNHASLKDVTFEYCDLSYAQVEMACFTNCTIKNCKFENVNAKGAIFSQTPIENTSLANTNFKNARALDSSGVPICEPEHLERLRSLCEPAANNIRLLRATGDQLNDEEFGLLRSRVFFPVWNNTLNFGNSAKDGGPPSLYTTNNNKRELNTETIINSSQPNEVKALTNDINNHLLSNKFTNSQKHFFHWLRAALWLPQFLIDIRLGKDQAKLPTVATAIHSDQAKAELYDVRRSREFKEKVFEIVLAEYIKRHPVATTNKGKQVAPSDTPPSPPEHNQVPPTESTTKTEVPPLALASSSPSSSATIRPKNETEKLTDELNQVQPTESTTKPDVPPPDSASSSSSSAPIRPKNATEKLTDELNQVKDFFLNEKFHW